MIDTRITTLAKIKLLKRILKLDISLYLETHSKYHIYFKHYHFRFTNEGVWLNGNHFTAYDGTLYDLITEKFNQINNLEADVLSAERDLKLGKIL